MTNFQSRVRVIIATNRYARLRLLAEAYARELNYRATKMQALYRGKRARMMTRIKMHRIKQKRRRLCRGRVGI